MESISVQGTPPPTAKNLKSTEQGANFKQKHFVFVDNKII